MMASSGELTTVLAQVMLLESFIDQASRYMLRNLTLRTRVGRLQEKQLILKEDTENDNDGDGTDGHNDRNPKHKHQTSASISSSLDMDISKNLDDLYTLETQLCSSIDVVENLRARIEPVEPTESLRIRSRIYEFINVCFNDIMPKSHADSKPDSKVDSRSKKYMASVAESGTAAANYSYLRQVALAPPEKLKSHPQGHPLWSLIRPSKPPSVILQLFLALSAQVAQLHRNHYDPTMSMSVGEQWYALLSALYSQLIISSHTFDDFSLIEVLDSMQSTNPESSTRESLHPSLWRTSDDLKNRFDHSWKELHKLLAKFTRTGGSRSQWASFEDNNSPHAFCIILVKYLEAVLDRLDAPTLDTYSQIRKSGKLPHGFFEAPGDLSDIPKHPQLVYDDEDEDINFGQNSSMVLGGDEEGGGSRSALEPTLPYSVYSTKRVKKFSAAEYGDDEASQSPSERIAQTQAYSAMKLSSARQFSGNSSSAITPLSKMRISGDDDDDSSPSSPTDDILLQRRAGRSSVALNRKRKVDLSADNSEYSMFNSDMMSPSHENASMLVDETLDIHGTAAAESPTALLSARRDKRLLPSIQGPHAPPPPMQSFRDTPKNAEKDHSPQTTPKASASVAVTRSALTTPKSQIGDSARVDRRRYVSHWAEGDIEGGGRPHRQRRYQDMIEGKDGEILPPPQTLLSPKNLSKVTRGRKSMRVDSPMNKNKDKRDADNEATENQPMYTPEKPAQPFDDPMAQVTPEHQIGASADPRTLSATRYVKRWDRGDMEGGGRKRRKRQYDPGTSLKKKGHNFVNGML